VLPERDLQRRLPSSNELQTLVDYAKPSPGPMTDVAAFPDALAVPYWTVSFSKMSVGAPAMTVNFKDGTAVPAPGMNRVRCVR